MAAVAACMAALLLAAWALAVAWLLLLEAFELRKGWRMLTVHL